MSRIFLTYLSFCLCLLLHAESHSTVTLKNGSVIEGDIVVQRFGKDITIEAEKATLVIEPKDIVSKKPRKVQYENLSRDMKRWVLENRALKGDAYGRYAELSDIQTKKYSYSGLINKPTEGKESTVYVHPSPTTFTIKWDDIQTITKNSGEDIRYDLTDKVTTASGKSYEGKIVNQETGRNITIETPKGKVTIPNKDIKEITKTAPKGSNNIFAEIDFENVIILKDGSEKEGLITTNHYGNNPKDNYIILSKKNGKPETILNSKISEYRTRFKKKGKVIYVPGKVYVNEFKIDKAHSQRMSNSIVFLEKQVFPFPEGIGITFKSDGTKLAGKWSLISLSELSTSGGHASRGYDLGKKAENTIPPSSQEQASGITQITYGYLSPGYYALVNDSDTEAYVFKITK